jgi:hypothetical protein
LEDNNQVDPKSEIRENVVWMQLRIAFSGGFYEWSNGYLASAKDGEIRLSAYQAELLLHARR